MADPAPRVRLGRNYWKLWIASVISNFGDGLSAVAYPWLVSAVTRDPVAIAGIGIVRFLPWLVFSLPAGVLTDRYDRRRLVATMDGFRFVVTLGIALIILPFQSGLASPEEIAGGTAAPPDGSLPLLVALYVSALLFGLAEVLRDNSAQTLLPSMVDKENLEHANGRLSSAEIVMNTFIGPPLAGPLLAIAFVLPFFVDAASFAVAAGLVFTITGKTFQPARTGERRTIRADLGEGFRWLWHHTFLRRLAIALGLTNGLGMMAGATFVLFAQEILHLDALGFGLVGTGFAIGAVAGGTGAAKVTKKLGSGIAILGTLWLMAITLTITGLISNPAYVWGFGILQGFSGSVWNVVTVSLRQQIIPDHLLGRVNSVYRFFGWGSMPIGTALGGIIADQVGSGFSRPVGLRTPFVIAGVGHVLLAIWAWPRLNTRTITEARRGVSSEDQSDTSAGSGSD